MLPLPPAFVVTGDTVRLRQFREAWRAVGLPGDCVAEWSACVCPAAPSLGNAVAQYALARHALASGITRLLVFEDDAVPREDAAALLPGYLADAAARGVSALRLGWIPLPSDDPPPDGRAVLGSHAYALLSREAIEDYCEAWPDLAKADAVFVPMRGPVECAAKNLFAQFIPATAASHGIHGARGRFNHDPRVEKIRKGYADAFRLALSSTEKHEEHGEK